MADYLQPHYWAKSALGLNTYQWQKDALASMGKRFPTCVVAPNGSGKSSVTLTVAILWFLKEHPKGRCVVTSGSWSQLKSQVFDSLKRFSDLDIFRGWEFLEASTKTPQGGYAIGLSVDDSYKMEGFHPRSDSPTLLCVDEGKAIGDSVYDSVDKCTWTYQLVVSSAGPASGRFHKFFTAESDYWVRRTVTYRECPHLNERQRLADIEIRGENSPYYKNRWLSEFSSDSGTSMISLDALRACAANPPEWTNASQVSAGADFAAGGGDFCCCAVARGNKLELDPDHYWRHSSPKHSVGKFVTIFRKLGLRSDQIAGDAGGLGVGFIYDLQEAGYYIREVHNGAAAKRADLFANLAAEWWDGFNVLVSNRAIILPANEKLFQQLSDRRKEYVIVNGGVKTKLESKLDMRARGASSPDLADSVILAALSGYCGTQACLTRLGTNGSTVSSRRASERCGRMRRYNSRCDFMEVAENPHELVEFNGKLIPKSDRDAHLRMFPEEIAKRPESSRPRDSGVDWVDFSGPWLL